MTDTLSHYFRPVTIAFLEKSWGESFEIYYKINKDGNDLFLKFADYTPDVHEKLLAMMQEDNHQELFIHENDLLKYFKRVLINDLRNDLANTNPTPIQAISKVYPVAARILNEYFENKTSGKILRTLDEIPGILIPHMAREILPFPAVYKLTRKTNSAYIHCLNVGLYCMNLALHLKMSEVEIKEIFMGGMLADVGKKFVPYEILMKKETLTEIETHHVRKHPSAGRKLLNDMKCYPETVLAMAAEHHENFDGSGYPSGKTGAITSLGSRICWLMDVFNALTSERSFRKPISPAAALSKIKMEMSAQVDQKILVEFINSLDPELT